MSFKLDDSDEQIIKGWPVVISIPQDGGGIAKHEIAADYLLLPQDELDELLAASRESDSNTDIDILRRVVRKISGVQDSEGKTLDYSEELFSRLMKRPYIRSALVTTYFEAAIGKKAKRKN